MRYDLAFEPTNAVAFLTAPGPFVDLVAARSRPRPGRRPALSTTGGTSDARFIKEYCPVVEFGLVGQTMHQIDERVAVADLDRLAAIYRRVLDAYFAGCRKNLTAHKIVPPANVRRVGSRWDEPRSEPAS